ncbi:MAG TPA: hypothetical protein VG711_10650 [Phycisphaerales bacterium]|nr:hypothetical protein [Phycisphaerales bacterium]
MADVPGSDLLSIFSIIRMPPGLTDHEFAQVISRSSQLDIYNVRMACPLVPPQVLGLVPRSLALKTIAALSQYDGDAFAPTLEDIIRLGPSIRLKSMKPAGEVLQCQLWRAPNYAIPVKTIRVVVRAMKFNTLDIHTSDHRVFQVGADKFNFDGLGAARGLSENANLNALSALLTSLAPDAIMDDFFPLWKPHTIIQKLKLPGMTLNNEDPAFAFYSRWVVLMYLHINSTSPAV